MIGYGIGNVNVKIITKADAGPTVACILSATPSCSPRATPSSSPTKAPLCAVLSEDALEAVFIEKDGAAIQGSGFASLYNRRNSMGKDKLISRRAKETTLSTSIYPHPMRSRVLSYELYRSQTPTHCAVTWIVCNILRTQCMYGASGGVHSSFLLLTFSHIPL